MKAPRRVFGIIGSLIGIGLSCLAVYGLILHFLFEFGARSSLQTYDFTIGFISVSYYFWALVCILYVTFHLARKIIIITKAVILDPED